jgi:hypothetical protein
MAKHQKRRSAGRLVAEGASFAGTSLVALIPLAGPVIAGAFTELELRHISTRLERFEQQLVELAGRIDHDRLDRVYVASLEYTDAAIAAIEAARRTSAQEKLESIAAILLGAATVDRPQGLDIEGMLSAVGDLSPAALNLLRLLTIIPDPIDGNEAPDDYPDVDFHLSWLMARGLIEIVHAPTPSIAARPGRPNFAPTDTYRRLEALMRAGGWRS